MADVVNAIAQSCEDMGQVELAGIKLEDADPKLLDVTHMDLDRHVAIQPAAIAYYNSLLREAQRRYDAAKRSYDRFEKKKMAAAKTIVMNAAAAKSSVTAADIQAQYLIDNDRDVEKWDTTLDRLKFEVDTLEVWCKAWRDKGFSINHHADITEDERWNNSTSTNRGGGETPRKRPRPGETPPQSRTGRVRGIIKNRRGAGNAAGDPA
jgi:hypothetical protein